MYLGPGLLLFYLHCLIIGRSLFVVSFSTVIVVYNCVVIVVVDVRFLKEVERSTTVVQRKVMELD